MGKKRKSDASRLDEVDRTLHSSFTVAANFLSQIYTQATQQKKLAFQVGERHALEKTYEWILRQHEEGSRVTTADILAYLQKEIDYGEDSSTSPSLPSQHQHPQPTIDLADSSIQASGLPGQTAVGLTPRTSHADQTKNSLFSNALSSPLPQSLQNYHLAQHGGYHPDAVAGFGSRNHEANNSVPHQNRDSNYSDSSMDMQ